MITDGQVHDIPAGRNALGFDAPLHALVTGRPDEFDRRIRFNKAPRYGISGKPLEMSFTVIDEGKSLGSPAPVDIRVNGQTVAQEEAQVGQETPITIDLPRAGVNIVEIVTPAQPGEVTDANNRAVATVDGIRENLRVLLVSGEPHNGERTWRNLLKSDAAVDLVHFTILRPRKSRTARRSTNCRSSLSRRANSSSTRSTNSISSFSTATSIAMCCRCSITIISRNMWKMAVRF